MQEARGQVNNSRQNCPKYHVFKGKKVCLPHLKREKKSTVKATSVIDRDVTPFSFPCIVKLVLKSICIPCVCILTSLPLPKKLQSTLLPHHFPKLLLLIHWAIWVHERGFFQPMALFAFLSFFSFILFYFIFKLYNIVLVLPNIEMNLPQVYMCSPS